MWRTAWRRRPARVSSGSSCPSRADKPAERPGESTSRRWPWALAADSTSTSVSGSGAMEAWRRLSELKIKRDGARRDPSEGTPSSAAPQWRTGGRATRRPAGPGTTRTPRRPTSVPGRRPRIPAGACWVTDARSLNTLTDGAPPLSPDYSRWGLNNS